MRSDRKTESLKILTVANMYPSAADPTYGTFVKNFVDRLNSLNEGGSNRVVTIYGRRKGVVAKLKAYAGYYLRLTKALLTDSYDLVYIHTITFPTPALRVASLFRRLPMVFNVHGDDVLPSNRFKKMLKAMSRPLLRKSLMIVSPSDYFKGVVLKEFPDLDANKIVVSASGGIDRKFFVTRPERPTSGRPIEIGFVSRIDQGKGWDIFLNSLAMLRAEKVPFHATIAGRGAQSDAMLKMIADYQLNDAVDYIGAVAHDELPTVYASFDLFIFPSTRENESLGLVGLEAMAAGTPVIASNMAGPAGYVSPGIDGYLFPPADAAALAGEINRFISLSDDEKSSMRMKSIEKAATYESVSVASALFNRLCRLIKASKNQF